MNLEDPQTFIEGGKWKCVKCGLCCKFAHIHPQFPKIYLKDQKCVHLKEDMSCGIYEKRPEVCKVDIREGSQKLAKACASMTGLLKELK